MIATLAIAACGSGTPSRNATGNGSSATNALAAASGLSYARCMRSHGVARFPDPSANGSINVHASGVNLSAAAARSAETACQSRLPAKHPPSQQPTAEAYARLLAWAKCMRERGTSGLPDPKPDPVPGPGSASASRFGTVMGDGGYWVGIPYTDDAHSPAFIRRSTSCGLSPTGRPHHHG